MHIATTASVRTIRQPKNQSKKSKAKLDAASFDAATDIGSQLKAHREQRRLSVEQVANRLKIRGHYIRAIEDGQFANIPGRIYVDGYLRNYADYLGLDSAMVVASYRGSGGRASNDDNYMLPEITHDEMKPGRPILWLALIVLLLIYGIWAVSDRKDEEQAQVIANNAPAAPAQAVKALDARVVILAKNDVDVVVLDVNGNPLYQNLMHSGETYFVPSDGLLLKTSVPGSLQIFVDGESVTPTGKAIVTEAGIVLNPDKLLENSGFKDNGDDGVE